MRICPKCSKQAGDGSKICRNCGAILEEVPDEEGRAPVTLPETSCSSRLTTAAKCQVADPEAGGGQPVSDELPRPVWKCLQCGETVPGTFDICWKCMTTREGEKSDQQDVGPLERDSDAEQEEQQIEPSEVQTEEGEPSLKACPRCGSTKMMWGVTVCDQDQLDGSLKAVVFGDPSALVFKDRLYGTLKADICGDCGHVELKVSNPGELYRHYRKAHG